MTAVERRLTALETAAGIPAAQRDELDFDLSAVSEADIRWLLDNFEKETAALTDDERARARAISKAMIVTVGGRRCEWRNTGEFDIRGGEWQVSKDG